MTRFILFALLGLITVGSAAADPPVVTLKGKQEGPVETFYQQVDIQRNPQFIVQGLKVDQQIHYQVTSSFDVYAADEKGNRKAVQTVNGAMLIKADPLSQAVFTQSLAEMRGRKFTYTINKFSEVVSMEGQQNNTKLVEVEQPQSKGMLVSSVIDEDGWKELADLTLFQPLNTGRSARSFVRKRTHDWGSLGSWYGKTIYTSRVSGRNAKHFNYQHQLEYIPPDKDAANASPDLPFSIESAKFRVYKGWGEIQYDQKHKHVTAVREVFHARGSVSTSMVGVASTVEIEEKQIFMISVTNYRMLKADKAQATIASGLSNK